MKALDNITVRCIFKALDLKDITPNHADIVKSVKDNDIDKFGYNEIHYICKYTSSGMFRFGDTNKLNLTDFAMRDKVKSQVINNESIIDKRIYAVMFKNEIIIDKFDLALYRLAVFSLLWGLSNCKMYVVIDDELYGLN